MENWRLFIGVPLKQGKKAVLYDFQMKQLYDPKINWVAAPNLHITMHFIGDYPMLKIPELKDTLHQFFSKFSRFCLSFDRLMLMPPKKPHMVWAKLSQNDAFTNLSNELAHLFGAKTNKKPIPHITLARFKSGADTASINLSLDQPFSNVQVQKVHLYQSVLKPDGPEYKIIDTYFLNE